MQDNDVKIVEGYVDQYHPMPSDGHDTEHFNINGVYFEYSNYEIVNGYHDAASLGGVITHDGQHLKIKYIEDDSGNNVILYIEKISP